MNITANQQIAKLNDLHIAPRKVRLIANVIKGLRAQEAESQLLMQNQRAAQPILKLLRSAMANAKNNKKMGLENLVVKSVIVNQGPMLKRFLPRAQGRATPIHKKMSHVTLILEETSSKVANRFIITSPVKKAVKKKAKTKTPKAKVNQPEREIKKISEKPGFFKRLFNRKSV